LIERLNKIFLEDKMDIRKLEGLLKKLKSGNITIDEAVAQLKSLPFEDLGYARIDHHRSLRKGFPEVIWGDGKTAAEILSIMKQFRREESQSRSKFFSKKPILSPIKSSHLPHSSSEV
jgi:NCAIR mutase (PurE)-related protein